MPRTDYDKGFYVPLVGAPVSRAIAHTGKRPTIHVRITEGLSVGRFVRAAGELLCGAGEAFACAPVNRSLNAVTCVQCRVLLDRWAREAVARRCKGYAITWDGMTRAVAATSAVMAVELLGIDKGLMLRHGVRGIELDRGGRDRFRDIRAALRATEVGTVIARAQDGETWQEEAPRVDVTQAMGWRHERFAERGKAVREEDRLHNHSVRLAPHELDQMKALGGAAWLRGLIDAGATAAPSHDAGESTLNATVRTTHAQWAVVRARGGSAWIRALIRAASSNGGANENAPN